MPTQLTSITERILSDSISLPDLRVTLTEYKSLLLNATSLDLSESEHQSDIHLDNGIAIGLSWAASCLDDPIRTRMFILGAKQAIDQKLKEGNTSVHVLYAGTGPFATLILPLMCYFSPVQLQVTLLEINPASAENSRKIVSYFKLEDHVAEIRCADATKTIFSQAEKFDVLLSETMQHALQREQQVLICSHLLNQMKPTALLIPETIELELQYWNSSSTGKERFQKIGDLFSLNADFLRKHDPMNATWSTSHQFVLNNPLERDADTVVITTAIKVFNSFRIEWNESGLTVPKILMTTSELHEKSTLELKYVMDPEPGFILSE